MSNGKNIFLTGITGFLGSFLAVELLKKGYKIYGLARGKGDKSARNRVYDALKFAFYEDEWDADLVRNNVEVVEGDIVYSDFGIKSLKQRDFLVNTIDVIIHSAALAELRAPLELIRSINVGGTKNVMDFALEGQKRGRLKKVNHISTLYVYGDFQGKFDERMLDVGQKFHNTYEQTKFEAETLIKRYINKGLNCSIFRPSMVMGDSQKGKTNNFRLFYEPIHFFSKGIYNIFPINFKSSINLINVDSVVHAICSVKEKELLPVYHIVSPNDIGLLKLCQMASEYFGFNLPSFVSFEKFNYSLWTPIQRVMAEPFIPYFTYFNCQGFCEAETTIAALSLHGACPPEIADANLENIFKYCNESGYITTLRKNKFL